MIDTVVFDLDGILLRDMSLTEGGRSAVEHLLARGVRVLYSSGKHHWFTAGGLSFSRLLRPDTVIMAENGGVVFYPSTKETEHVSPDPEGAAFLRTYYVEERCTRHRGILTHRETGVRMWEEPKETILTLYPEDLSTIPAIAQELDDLIAAHGLALYTIAHSDAVDALPLGQNKGAALARLATNGELDLTRTAALGDGLNDREMLEIVELPMTVANAKQEVKSLVTARTGYIAQKAYGDGVLECVAWMEQREEV